jgi:hypothetical protein
MVCVGDLMSVWQKRQLLGAIKLSIDAHANMEFQGTLTALDILEASIFAVTTRKKGI